MANLPGGTHILSEAESQKLRAYCSYATYTDKDLDSFARLLQIIPLSAVKADFTARAEKTSIEAARKALSGVNWDPTKIGLYNYILQLTILNIQGRSQYMSYLKYYALEVKVPVDGVDLSGSTTVIARENVRKAIGSHIRQFALRLHRSEMRFSLYSMRIQN